MTDSTPAVLARVAKFLTGLSAAEVAALATGRARLALLPTDEPTGATAAGPTDALSADTSTAEPTFPAAPGAASWPVSASAVDNERAHAALAAMSRREDGTAYLSSWTARDLRALAARAGLRGVTGLRKMELVERIVDRTIGFRLDSTAIRQR